MKTIKATLTWTMITKHQRAPLWKFQDNHWKMEPSNQRSTRIRMMRHVLNNRLREIPQSPLASSDEQNKLRGEKSLFETSRATGVDIFPMVYG